MLLVDGANMVGSRPTGWWRDRAGAARQLCDRLRAAVSAGRLDRQVVLVLEGAARYGVPEGSERGVQVRHAPASGDELLVQLAADTGPDMLLVSADRELGERVRRLGGDVVGPNWLWHRL